MAVPWDQHSLREQQRMQNALLRQTVLQMALMHVPFVRARLEAIGLDARTFKGLEHLDRLPLTLRRDVLDEKRNPAGTAALIVQATVEGVKRFSDRNVLRRVALARLFGGADQQQLAVESATRAIHMHLVPGPGGRVPVGYTRDDLDLLARAGARLGVLSGLERGDRLLNAVPFGPTLEFWGIFYMAHGMGMSAVHVRREHIDLARALSVFDEGRATAVAVLADEALSFTAAAVDAGIDLSALNVLIAVGRSLTTDERIQLAAQLEDAGAGDARVAVAYGVAEGRVLWGECAVPAGHPESFGFHTFPDLDLVEVVSPETGQRLADETAGEIVVTPLGFRGGGAPRWRSGDLAVGGVTRKPCPNCGRTVPRLGPTVVRGAWQYAAVLNGRRVWLDLRDAAAAASDRAPIWQVELVRRDGAHELFVHLAAEPQPGPLIEIYAELQRLKFPPTQIVLGSVEQIQQRIARAPGPWPRY